VHCLLGGVVSGICFALGCVETERPGCFELLLWKRAGLLVRKREKDD